LILIKEIQIHDFVRELSEKAAVIKKRDTVITLLENEVNNKLILT